MRIGALCLLGVWLLIGCGGGGHHDVEDMDAAVLSADSGTGSHECVDEDGDGFGKACKKGRDCNDGDPDITDECVRCRDPKKPGIGCPCLIDGGTPDPMKCDPDDLHTTQNGLYAPYDAKVIGDYTGLTPPFGFEDLDMDDDGD